VEVKVAVDDKLAVKLAKYWGADAVLTAAQCCVLALFPHGDDPPCSLTRIGSSLFCGRCA
jgi:hypothetical protein